MKLSVEGRLYPIRSVEDLTLLEILQLERETRELGRPLTMSILAAMEKTIEASVSGRPKAEQAEARAEHPDSQWLIAVAVWAARRGAGDKVTFEEAISFPITQLAFVPETDDEQASVDAVDPTQARPGSVRAAKPRARASSTKTSKRVS